MSTVVDINLFKNTEDTWNSPPLRERHVYDILLDSRLSIKLEEMQIVVKQNLKISELIHNFIDVIMQ